MPGELCHFEIGTRDLEKAKKFYAALFNWNFEEDPTTGYAMINTGKEPGGGLFKTPPEVPLGVTSYIMVDNIEETLKKVEELGGQTLKPKQEIPNMGWWALFQDQEGNVLGIYEKLQK